MYCNCQKCGKKLTDPESMKRGYGPECWEQISGEKTTKVNMPIHDYDIPGQMNIFDFPDYCPREVQIDEK